VLHGRRWVPVGRGQGVQPVGQRGELRGRAPGGSERRDLGLQRQAVLDQGLYK
jgi:hypothetical protein